MLRVRPAIALLALLGGLAGGPAWAQGRRTPEQRRAVDLFERSEAAYADGRFAEAATLLREAYQLSPAPILLYNLARALEGAGDLHGTIDAYAAYLRAETQSADRASIEQRIATLRRQLQEREALARQAEQAEQAAAIERARTDRRLRDAAAAGRTARGPSIAPWIATGLGVAGVGAGIVLGRMAVDRRAAADAEPVQLFAEQRQNEAQTLALGASVGFVAGGVLAGIGAIWGIVDLAGSGDESASSRAVRFTVGPGFAYLLVRGSWP